MLGRIDILQEEIQRREPLDDPSFYAVPLGRSDDAGNNIERKNTFDAGIVAVNGEGDPLVQEKFVRKLLFLLQRRIVKILQRLEDAGVVGPDLILIAHLIPTLVL